MFASELKSFHKVQLFDKEIDSSSVALFFRHGYIDSPHCIYKYVKKLQPGKFLVLDMKSGTTQLNTYWDPIDCYNAPKLDISFKEAKSELKNLLSSAFSYRMISDVPVGIFLSGGYDSSTTAAILSSDSRQKINTYTIGFEGSKYDESYAAEGIANHLGTNHETLHLNSEHLKEILPSLPYFYDEPFGDSSAIPSILVSKLAKKHVSVVLSSDGGDELFAGYPKHYQHARTYQTLSRIPYTLKKQLSFLERHKRFKHREGLFSARSNNELYQIRLETVLFNDKEMSKMLGFEHKYHSTSFEDFKYLNEHNDYINKLLAVDYKTYLENDILTKVDRATMSQSIEGREPYLDHRLIEFCARLNSKFKYNNGVSKYILKEINKDYIPEHLMEKEKKGFGGPVNQWLREFLKDELVALINSSEFPEHILNKKYIQKYVNGYIKSEHNEWYKTYQIYTFLSWFKYWN